MYKTIGILAHVDAGKTTFSEHLLFHANAISSIGRVDHQNSFLDTNHIERQRGITIFSGEAYFSYGGDHYFLIDTPGHIDFSAETERAVSVMDYAVLIINIRSAVQSHTITLFQLLEKYQVPVFLFINKTDLPDTSVEACLQDIYLKLNIKPLYLQYGTEKYEESVIEDIISNQEDLVLTYLDNKLTKNEITKCLASEFKNRTLFPCMSGSALNNVGIKEFLSTLHSITETNFPQKQGFIGSVFKIRYDKQGNRLTFLKCLSGEIHVKDSISFSKDVSEKINQIRMYHGDSFQMIEKAEAGMIVAVTGLTVPSCGSMIGDNTSHTDYEIHSVLTSKIEILDGSDFQKVLDACKILEAEDPMLQLDYQNQKNELCIHVMGKIQLEVLKQTLLERFSISVDFKRPEVVYMETLNDSVNACGHFEPLRHYAEVHFRMEPGKRGSGIRFSSECHVDQLAIHYQNLIQTHVFEKQHKGVLTCSPLTDIHIILTNGKSHIKHTEGGDFREAVYRAIRQGMEQAESVLLEPFYQFQIFASMDYMGRILSDIPKLYGTFDQPIQNGNFISITGRGPVATFMEYPTELISFTKGTGTIQLKPDGYDICHNSLEVIETMGYNREADLENTSYSVFCSHGSSDLVPWYEAADRMHCT